MSSFTIHNLDADIDMQLTIEAKKNKKSKNQLIKELLAKSLGLAVQNSYVDDYGEFCGLWSAEEAREFTAAQEDNNRIDNEEWV